MKNVDKTSCVSTLLRGGFGARGEGREEVHFKCLGEASGRAEGDIHVTAEDLDDIRT